MARVLNEETGQFRRYYRESAPDVRYPSVTSIVDHAPKKFLPRWYADMAADLALDSIDYVARMKERDPRGAKKWLAGAAGRYTRNRGDVGSDAHDLFERMIRGHQVRRQSIDMEPYRAQFRSFLTFVNPELVRAEDVAWSDTYQYAGSFDAWLRLWVVKGADGTWTLDPGRSHPMSVPVDVIADWKTSKSVWASVALQMGGYAFADLIIDPDGTETPMPAFDGAVVLHITPEGWALYPVYLDKLQRAFRYFLHLRATHEWETADSKTALGKPLARSQRETGTERRG
ncbi:hypothetical protein ACWCXC_15620 [Streptomyces sp. NPDC001515]